MLYCHYEDLTMKESNALDHHQATMDLLTKVITVLKPMVHNFEFLNLQDFVLTARVTTVQPPSISWKQMVLGN